MFRPFIKTIRLWIRPESTSTQHLWDTQCISNQRNEIARLKERLANSEQVRAELQKMNTDLRTTLDVCTIRAMSDAFYRVLKSDNAR